MLSKQWKLGLLGVLVLLLINRGIVIEMVNVWMAPDIVTQPLESKSGEMVETLVQDGWRSEIIGANLIRFPKMEISDWAYLAFWIGLLFQGLMFFKQGRGFWVLVVLALNLSGWLDGFLHGSFFLASSILPFWYNAISFVVSGLMILSKRKQSILAYLLIPIFILALTLRIRELAEVAYQLLDPDVGFYKLLAETSEGLYRTGVREPLYVWYIQVIELLGGRVMAIRLLSVVWSMILILVTVKTFKNYLSQLEVAAVAMLMAINPLLVGMSVRGLREEMYASVLMVLIYLIVYRGKKNDGWVKATGIGLLMSWALLLRFMAAPFLVAMLVYYGLWKNVNIAKLILMAAIPVLLFMPYLGYNKEVFGKATYFSDFQAKFQRNYEFVLVRKIGCPGCPTAAEFEKDGYSGAEVTTFEYFFRLHTPMEVAKRITNGVILLLGIKRRLYADLMGSTNNWLWLLHIVGLGHTVVKKRWSLILITLASVNTICFLIPIGIDIRVVEQALPFLLAISAGALTPLVLGLNKVTNIIIEGKYLGKSEKGK